MAYTEACLAGLQRVLDRGTACVLEQSRHGLFIRDTVSGGYLLAVEETEVGIRWLQAHGQAAYSLLEICGNRALADYAQARYGLRTMLCCRQAVYRHAAPPATAVRLHTRRAGPGDLPMILRWYDMLSEEELRAVLGRGNLLVGETAGHAVGFVGEHLEGSMGMLFVLPAFRGQGFGAALESAMIRHTLRQGYRPFCQVETENEASMSLQKKLGLERSEEELYWLF